MSNEHGNEGKRGDCGCGGSSGGENGCGICAHPHFDRNRYFTGKLLTVRDLRAEQEYFQEKRWLLNRAVHGCGVVCGLDANVADVDGCNACVQLSPGLALDGRGREILVCDGRTVPVPFPPLPADCDEQARQHGADQREEHGSETTRHARTWVLCLEYAECRIEPVQLPADPCGGGGGREDNRVRDWYRLRWSDPESIAHPACGGPCPLEGMTHPGCGGEPVPPVKDVLCRASRKGCHGCCDCACVVLGTLRVAPRGHTQPGAPCGPETGQVPPCDEAQPQSGTDHGTPCPPKWQPSKDGAWCYRFEACAGRKLVYTNPLLYGLIDCYHGDLPRIVEVSWQKWHREVKNAVPWATFESWFAKNTTTNPNYPQWEPGPGLTVCFDRDMNPATIDPITFFVRLTMRRDSGRGYLRQRILPGEVHMDGPRRAVFVPDWEWVKDEITMKSSDLKKGFDVEVVLRASLILDTHGKALDGEAIGFPWREAHGQARRPTGNGSQGGDFISYFSVVRRAGGPMEQ